MSAPHPEARATPERPGHAPRIDVIATAGFSDYALLDSGQGRKLERFGPILVVRPETQALWRPRLDVKAWLKSHAVFSGEDDDEKGRWRIDRDVPASWPVRVGGVTMLMKLGGFLHMGLFPEQYPHWMAMSDELAQPRPERPRVLNLFGYTGAATLIAAAAGADVTHVDASKKSVAWGRENQAASGLTQTPVRWIVDDARKFAARDVRRGRSYHIILVDPPKFGRGPEGEVWDIFAHLPALLQDCAALLAPGRAMMILTAYALRASALAFDQLTRETLAGRGGDVRSGELAIREADGGRFLPTSLFTQWTSHDIAG